MSRKTLIIILVSVGIVVIGIGLYFFVVSRTTTDTTGATVPVYKTFWPFNIGSGTVIPANQNTLGGVNGGQDASGTTGEGTPSTSAQFHQISSFAVAGGTFLEDTRPLPKTDETAPTTFENVPAVRYVERATGHIYETYLDTGASGKISNSTIPAIYEALFDANANSVIYRYLANDNKTIETFIATLGAPSGDFLPENTSAITISQDGKKIFYLSPSGTGVSGTIQTFGETKKTQVFTSAFTEWLAQWGGNQKIFLTTKPSWSVLGQMYDMNTSTGALTKVFGGVLGLTTLMGGVNSNLILYSATESAGPKMSILQINTHTTTELNLYGLPEKCVWAPDGTTLYCAIPNSITGSHYPDDWYQGITSFNDSFVKINALTGESITLADSTDETAVDATHLFLDTSEAHLFFINKKDSTLWSLNLR